MCRHLPIAISVFLVFTLAHATSASSQKLSPDEAANKLGQLAEESRLKYEALTFEQFKAKVYKEPFEGGKYIVNGDVAIPSEKKLKRFYEENVKNKPPANAGPVTEFAIYNIGGLDQVWSRDKKRRLTYCVTTGFATHYDKVVVDMENATAAWEAVADIDFIHLAQEDGNCNATNEAIEFDVRPVDVGGRYLARAFFPNDLRADRNVLIDNSSFNLDPNKKLQLVGILRHELGHTIGARHEHTRPEAGACFEDSNIRVITDYDDMSCMQYPQCNGRGDWSLNLTPRDKNGAACVYGPSDSFVIDVSLVDVAQCPYAITTELYENQSVAQGELKTYGPFQVAAGKRFIATVTSNSDTQSDPDLYVKFDDEAAPDQYDCRPFRENATEEECSVEVPSDATIAFVAVSGYRDSQYNLSIEYYKR